MENAILPWHNGGNDDASDRFGNTPRTLQEPHYDADNDALLAQDFLGNGVAVSQRMSMTGLAHLHHYAAEAFTQAALALRRGSTSATTASTTLRRWRSGAVHC